MANWNGLDFFIFLIFFLNTVVGMSRGATKEIIALMCLSAALIFTIRFTVPLAAWLNTSPLIEDVVQAKLVQNFIQSIGAPPLTVKFIEGLAYSLSMLICFSSIYCITEASLNYTGFTEVFTFPWALWSRKVGGGLGCTRGYVLTLIFLSVMINTFGPGGNGVANSWLQGSWFSRLLHNSVARMDGLIAGQQTQRYQEIYKDKDLYNVKDIYNVIPKPDLLPGSVPTDNNNIIDTTIQSPT